MKKLLVTGGAGFIGSEFIDFCLKKYGENITILCVDNLTYAGKAQPCERFGSNPSFEFVKADICDSGAIDRLFCSFQPDVVVNFAAESHVDRSIVNPLLFYKTNVEGTLTLLEAARKFGIKRFHQVSTDEVYGSCSAERLFTERDILLPSSPYSASKAAADLACLSYAKTFGLNVTITRSANNYGRYQFPEKLIPVVVCSALLGKKIPLYGRGESVRNWLFVTDNCKAIDCVINNGKAGEIYNVAGGCSLTNADVVYKILDILGCGRNLIEYVPDRPGRDLGYFIDDSKLNTIFEQKKTDFDIGLSQTVKWYVDNKNWWYPLFNK